MKCPICNGNSVLKIIDDKIEFRKEEFKIKKHFYECTKCNEKFTTTEIDELNINQVYNQFREKYKIPFPEQLIKIKKKYELSAAKMAEVLGFGINIYRNYENGEIPNISNGTLLNLIREPEEFLKIVRIKEELFTENQYRKITAYLDELISEEQKENIRNVKKLYWNENIIPNEYTGYAVPSFEKFANIILYFLQKNGNLFKVRLNKLLYYSDFFYYKNYGYSISGCQYQAIQMGPVPYHYDAIYNLLVEENIIDFELADVNSSPVEKPFPKKHFDKSIFSEGELQTLSEIQKQFKKKSTAEIVEQSHNEKGWLEENKKKNLISYLKYGFEVNI